MRFRSISLRFLLLSLLLVSPSMLRAECADFSGGLHWVDGVPLVEDVNAAVTSGSLLYVVTGCRWSSSCPGSLEIFDISDPLAPVALGSLATAGSGRDLVVADGVAYVAEGTAGLLTVDVSDPSSPTVLGLWGSEDGQDVKLVGTTAYLLTEETIYSIDVTDPSVPTTMGSLDQGGTGMALGGGYAYVFPGLTVVDVADPGFLQLAAEDVIVPSSPGDPLHEGQALLDGDLLYAAYNYDVVHTEHQQARSTEVFDVSDPSNPIQLHGVWRWDGTAGVRLALMGDEVFVNWGGLSAISTSGGWTDTGTWAVGCTEMLAHGDDLLVFGGGALHLFHAGSLPEDPWIGLTDVGTTAGLLVKDGFAYLSHSNPNWHSSRLEVVDVTDPEAPVGVGGFLDAPDWDLTQIRQLDEDHIVLTQLSEFSLENEVNVLDVVDPASPSVAGTLAFADLWNSDLVMAGDFGYLVVWDPFADETGILPVDFSDPTSPALGSAVPVPGWAWEGAFLGSSLVTVGQSTLTVFTETSPGALTFSSEVDLSPYVLRSVVLRQNHAYVRGTFGGHDWLLTFDLTSPMAPDWVETRLLLNGGRMDVEGSLLVVGGRDFYDLGNPDSPVPVPGFRDERPATVFDLAEGRLFTSGFDQDPISPTGYFTAYDLPCADPSEVAWTSSPGVDRYRIEVVPNPSSGSQEFWLRGPDAVGPGALGSGTVGTDAGVLAIFDARGRLVRRLTPQPGPDGSLATWNGRDERGYPVASGVYWTRLELGDERLGGTLVRIP